MEEEAVPDSESSKPAGANQPEFTPDIPSYDAVAKKVAADQPLSVQELHVYLNGNRVENSSSSQDSSFVTSSDVWSPPWERPANPDPASAASEPEEPSLFPEDSANTEPKSRLNQIKEDLQRARSVKGPLKGFTNQIFDAGLGAISAAESIQRARSGKDAKPSSPQDSDFEPFSVSADQVDVQGGAAGDSADISDIPHVVQPSPEPGMPPQEPGSTQTPPEAQQSQSQEVPPWQQPDEAQTSQQDQEGNVATAERPEEARSGQGQQQQEQQRQHQQVGSENEGPVENVYSAEDMARIEELGFAVLVNKISTGDCIPEMDPATGREFIRMNGGVYWVEDYIFQVGRAAFMNERKGAVPPPFDINRYINEPDPTKRAEIFGIGQAKIAESIGKGESTRSVGADGRNVITDKNGNRRDEELHAWSLGQNEIKKGEEEKAKKLMAKVPSTHQGIRGFKFGAGIGSAADIIWKRLSGSK